MHEVEVLGADGTHGKRAVLQPVHHSLPVSLTYEHNGETPYLLRLDERERLEKLIHGAGAPGKITYATAYFTNMSLRTKK